MNTTTKLLAFVFIIFGLYQNIQAQYQTTNNIGENKYLNPIFPGDNPDPSIIRDGENYYKVHSSFEYYPGLLIWESSDLINWTPVTNALHSYVGSVWAPDIVKYNNKYYIYFPAQKTNYVITADNIEGPWSEPVDLHIEHIDPGHIADDEGNRYLYFSSGAYIQLAADGLSTVGEIKHSYDGWKIPEEWSIEGFFMEGPKLVKHGEYYYITVAQGGTAGPPTGHMVISARSKSPLGPWENSPYNPIARTQKKSEQWWSVGHGTVFEDAHNEWWMVLHGYEKDYLNMGRQSLLVPIEWTEDGWYKIPDDVKINEPISKPQGKATKDKFTLSDTFDGEELKLNWKFFGEYKTSRYSLENGELVLKAKGSSVADCSPMLCVPTDHSYTADIEMEIEGDAIGGLVLFYNPQAYSGILADTKNIFANLRGWQFVTEENVINKKVHLRLKNMENTVDMFYSLDGKNWNKIQHSAEVSAFHHNAFSGFLSLRIGLCAVGTGTVKFKNFAYTPIK